MMTKSYPHNPSLSFEQAVKVWPMHWSGLYQHQIAAELFTNQGRISDVLNEKTHIGSRQAALQKFSA